MFMIQDSLDKFTKSEGCSVGADAAVALVSATLGKPIPGFVFRETGLIGDVSLEGSRITKIKTAG
jgi:lipid-binding SYLF domain-containing protein